MESGDLFVPLFVVKTGSLTVLCDKSQDIGISLESGAFYLQVVGCHHIQVFLL